MRLTSPTYHARRSALPGRRNSFIRTVSLSAFALSMFAASIVLIGRIAIQPADMMVIVTKTPANETMDAGAITKARADMSPILDPAFLKAYEPKEFSPRIIRSASFEPLKKFHNPSAPELLSADAETPDQQPVPMNRPQIAAIAPTPVQPASQTSPTHADIPAPPVRPVVRAHLANRQSLRERMVARVTAAPAEAPSLLEKLFGTRQDTASGAPLAYASQEDGLTRGMGRAFSSSRPTGYDNRTAVYDISARTVYLPNGTRLEAHSGLGPMLDSPDHVHLRMRGATPPHIYNLREREALFHGVRAIRLLPVGGEGAIHGRTGLLAHTFMLGPKGDSNGCVSFKNYDAFLRAYLNGEITRLAVVAGR